MITSPKKNKTILFAFVISLFGTLFLWSFWTYGPNAVGLNGTVYAGLLLAFFIYLKRKNLSRGSLYWIIPLGLICLSLGIYTNFFTKTISLVLLPLIFFLFSTHEAHAHKREHLWSRGMAGELIYSASDYLSGIFRGFSLFSFQKKRAFWSRFSPERKSLVLQIVLGLLFFLILAGLVIVPLLSSADQEFEGIFAGIMTALGNVLEYIGEMLTKIFEASFVAKILMTLMGMMFFLGCALYWTTEYKRDAARASGDFEKKYSVMFSIVLIGVLVLYVIFIGVQIKTLFVGSLPIEFKATEHLVKTGFWQLFLLTLINIAFYVGLYQKSSSTVQNTLGLFSVASLFLILSAGHRMLLYVTHYGLSYEKFYALFTVLFCMGIFVWFFYLYVTQKENPAIVRYLAFASLWMYASTTIIPLERMIFQANLSWTQQADSRININELHMLSFDALPLVERHFETLMAEAQKDQLQHVEQFRGQMPEESIALMLQEDPRQTWTSWLKEHHNRSMYRNYYLMEGEQGEKKQWYEKTISELIY